MTILVRADAGPELGSGHVVRCANLVQRLRDTGELVVLAASDVPPALAEWLHAQDLSVSRVPPLTEGVEDAASCLRLGLSPDLVIVDHYALDAQWESVMRSSGATVVVIDDLADRPHECDFLIDPSPGEDLRVRYEGLVPDDARLFLGPAFALLREDFLRPDLARVRDGTIQRVLVFLGGGVTSGQVLAVLEAIDSLEGPLLEVVALLGYSFPDPAPVHDFAAGRDWLSVVGVTDDVPALMSWADLAVGSCGGASWERCALGLPALAAVTAGNQLDNAKGLTRAGAAVVLGRVGDTTVETWARALQVLVEDPVQVRAMSSAALRLTSGSVAARVELADALRRRP